ncbi:MAG: ribonuclease E/G [Clostridium sp.]|uniref:ribonuclease E/G n=1 Tax=unclassified Clostridium TaxID=2614128 RepID=UPI000E492FC7|nr:MULTISPECIES: ribonuclease E/G [unclassified Clostridium]MEE0031110.1 ribonuclease E/G [Lachnospiraceae bacterium]RHQ13473.1 ribonuclease E/G [Clostridium sp. AM49-4BH]RHV15397.1 ribonuclease E/G [Clostridium sp. OM05-9BH]RHV19743.1 ribonuclease E/G [Clostridium sp. OM05-6BH]
MVNSVKEELLVTRREDKILFARVQDGKIVQLQAEDSDGGILGNIYVAKVRNIVKNINAAFVEFAKGQMGYLPLTGQIAPIHTDGTPRNDDRILIGDELIVQVTKEAVKTKPPTVSCAIELPGRYAVLTRKNGIVTSVSKKIQDEDKRENLRCILQEYAGESYGFVARTNSASCEEMTFRGEIEGLVKQYEQITKQGIHRTVYSVLYRAADGYLSQIRDSLGGQSTGILTDDEELYAQIQTYLEAGGLQDSMPLTLWDPDHGKMDAVYDISRTIEKVLRPKVWLRGGGYLIIQPTEALIAIDVNTGKAISKKKDVEKTFLKVNMEAVEEIARQLRLRNLSGMILIDFIDMKDPEHKEKVLQALERATAKDPVQTTVVDMTALGLVEVTRKKVRKSFYEQLKKGQD